jgi:hypothetical protein
MPIATEERGDANGEIDYENLSMSMHQVGFCLFSLNKFNEALPWFERAVTEKEQGSLLGQVDAESVVLSLRNGDDCLRMMGQEAEAQKWEDRAAKYPMGGRKAIVV